MQRSLMLDIIVVGALVGVLFILVRRLLQRMAVARRQSARIAADGEIAEGGISYGAWYQGMALFTFATTLPLWIASALLGGNAALFILGCFPGLFVLIFGLGYQKAGCCGGGGVVRLKSALPPVAVEVEHWSPENPAQTAAVLRRDRQSWFERTFYPILLLEELERHPPRRPPGTFKVRMPSNTDPQKTYLAATFSGQTLFTVPPSTRGGDLVWVKFPDAFSDGTTWGDNAPENHVPVTIPAQDMMFTENTFAAAKTDVKDLLNEEAWSTADMSTLQGQLTRVNMIKERGHPPMTVVTASTLRAIKKIPRSSDGCSQELGALLAQHGNEKKMTPEGDLTNDIKSDKPGLLVVFVSHSWIRKQNGHPDDVAGHKAMAMVQFAGEHVQTIPD